jgi:hypothetical protein
MSENELRIRHRVRADAAVGFRKLGGELRTDARELRFRLSDADVRFEAGDDLVVRALPSLGGEGIDDERRPHGLANRKCKFIGHDANHHAVHAIGADRPPDDVGRAAVSVPPQFVAEEHHRLRARTIVALAEPAAEQRFHAERFESGGGELAAGEAFGAPLLIREIHRSESVGADLFERALSVLDDRQVVHAHRLARLILGRRGAHDGHNPVGVGERQAFEQTAVDHAEHGGAEADAEAQREHRDQRKRRIFDEHSHAGAKIAEEMAHN